MSCLLKWAAFLWIVHTIPCTAGMAVNERIDNSRCPPLKVDKDRFSYSLNGPQPEFTGFDLTEKFLLRKGAVTEERPSFRLGSSPLIKPTELVFPNGLSSEYSLVTTFRLRKTTKKDRWYLWQIFDQTGGTQVSVVLDGAKRAVEFSARGLLKNSLHYTFKSRDLHTLFDRQWHKLGVAVQSSIVSVYMDCKLIERRLTDEKDEIDPSGYTLITTRVEDGRPVDIELQQILIYCDPYLAEMENCCEQAGSTCEPSREGPGAGGVTPNPLDTAGAGQLPQMLSQPVQPAQVQRVQHSSSGRCQCSAGKGDQGLPGLAGLPGQKGDQGDKGETGKDGFPGNSSQKGDQGVSGFPGRDGIPGQKGEAGSNGSKGIDGAMGETGSAGEPGAEGKPGINGLKGDSGPIGPKGHQGDTGLQGLPGLSVEKEGLKGDQGSPGLPGQTGALGKEGKRGRRGKMGEPGPRGLPSHPQSHLA
ncbi:collagen alpha-1(XIX) chain [Salvelinus fontinalis]|uniref:collagen alpha-1(XIX) chain n=1 Tax=Salvelinus fontinalis TaxID=8038 RepID=UPI002485A251|nr:collagen alpha-1(XIX) chain [Salvelinus fontinalis]